MGFGIELKRQGAELGGRGSSKTSGIGAWALDWSSGPDDIIGAAKKHGGALLERDVHLGEAAGCCRVHGRHHTANVPSQHRPLGISQNDDGDFPPL